MGGPQNNLLSGGDTKPIRFGDDSLDFVMPNLIWQQLFSDDPDFVVQIHITSHGFGAYYQ